MFFEKIAIKVTYMIVHINLVNFRLFIWIWDM